jgi:hypothetical protein
MLPAWGRLLIYCDADRFGGIVRAYLGHSSQQVAAV